MRVDDGGARLTIDVTGTECALEDLQLAVAEFLRGWKRERVEGAPERKPCGCKEAKSAG